MFILAHLPPPWPPPPAGLVISASPDLMHQSRAPPATRFLPSGSPSASGSLPGPCWLCLHVSWSGPGYAPCHPLRPSWALQLPALTDGAHLWKVHDLVNRTGVCYTLQVHQSSVGVHYFSLLKCVLWIRKVVPWWVLGICRMICCEGFGIEMTDESCGRCPRVLYVQRLFGEMAAGLVCLVLCLVSDAQEPPGRGCWGFNGGNGKIAQIQTYL